MRSIKPGRGPSMMGGFMGIIVAIGGVLWTAAAVSMGAPIFFILFGVVFVIAAIGGVIYNFMNATNKNRYSSFDITDDNEEPDPLNEKYGQKKDTEENRYVETKSEFCPYCGTKANAEYEFCNKCGKKLP
ncbi:MAG: hypothetical protein A2Y17_02160 [Clostridiales bacterium GWF2_38_85]|nr:MAG: hypothetical protein A2Y17_02160 [Clostridiales bacterium GWF2_38_85]HBL85114.1 zinc ribbon domain-containing protein [Clostridiales bacterium]